MPVRTTQQINDALDQGMLPQEFVDQQRLLPHENAAAQAFSLEAYRIAERLLGPAYDPHKVAFMLSADDQPNAWIRPFGDRSLIVFTRGLIELAQSEDEIAAVMAHEFGHEKMRERLGLHANGKGEEAFADARAVFVLRNAHPPYRQDAVRTLMERLPESAMHIFNTLRDPHPNKALRVRICDNAEKFINHDPLEGKGEQRIEFTPRPDSVLRVLPDATYESHIEGILRQEGFADVPPALQMDIISNVIQHAEVGLTGDHFYDYRYRELGKAITSIKPDASDPEQQRSFDGMINRILKMQGTHSGKLYQAAQTAWTGEEIGDYDSLKPYGQLRELHDAMRTFVDAQTPEEAQASATKLNALAEKHFKQNSTLAKRVDWPEFQIPGKKNYSSNDSSQDGTKTTSLKDIATAINDAPDKKREGVIKEKAVKPSWDRHVGWALESGWTQEQTDVVSLGEKEIEVWKHTNAAEAENIAVAMGNLLIVDSRLEQLFNDHKLSERISRSRPDFYSSPDPRFFKFDQTPDGVIMGERGTIYNESNPRPLKASDLLQRQSDRSTALIRSKDWKKEIENQGAADKIYTMFCSEFCQQNEDVLMPTVVKRDGVSLETTGNTKFAKAYCNHLRSLLAKDPEKYKPFVELFFAGEYEALHTASARQQVLLSGDKWDDANPPRENEFAIPRDHPYAKFVLENPAGALSPQTRAKVLGTVDYFQSRETLEAIKTGEKPKPRRSDRFLDDDDKPTGRNPYDDVTYAKCWKLDPQRAWPMPAITKFADILEIINKTDHRVRDSSFFRDRFHYEVARFLEKNKEGPHTQAEMDALLEGYKAERNINHPSYNRLLEQHIERYIRREASSDLAAEELAKNYRKYNEYIEWSNATKPFEINPRLRRVYEEAIVEAIKNAERDDPRYVRKQLEHWNKIAKEHGMELKTEADFASTPAEINAERSSACWTLLKGNGKLTNPDFREFVIDTYVKTKAEGLGKETSNNQDRIRATIDEIYSATSGDVRFALLTKFADAVETQKELSFYIRDKLNDGTLEQLVKERVKEAVGEAGLEYMSRDESLRKATLDYLTSPLTDKSIKGFQDAIASFRKAAGYIPYNFTLLENKLNEHQKYEQVRSLHENFHALPFGGRQVLLEKVLFPLHEDSQEAFDKNMKYAMDKVFARTGRDGQIARDWVESFMEVSDVPEKRLLLSAMLVGGDAETGSRGSNIGKTIKNLKWFGAPGVKALQAADSDKRTPEHIRSEIADSKSSKELPRWKVFEWLDAFGPDRKPGNPKTVHVGQVCMGSCGATVPLIKDDDTETACTLLKPSVTDGQADAVFEKFIAAAKTAVVKHPQLTPVLEMLTEAQKSFAVERDMNKAARQALVAAENYNGMVVRVNGREIPFFAAEWLGNGDRYKETKVIQGPHFNDLPEGTPEERSFKIDTAKAQLAAEFYIRLSGRPPDNDRHGMQMRLSSQGIGQFDHGVQATEPPTAEQKMLMAEVITNAFKAHRGIGPFGGVPLEKAFAVEVEKAGTTPERREFLAGMQRGILAYSDFMEAAGATKEQRTKAMGEVIGSVFATGDVDSVIQASMRKNLGVLHNPIMSRLIQQGRNISIEHPAMEPGRATPVLHVPEHIANREYSFRLRSEAEFHRPSVGQAHAIGGIISRVFDMNHQGGTRLDKAALAFDAWGLSNHATGNAAGLFGNAIGTISQAAKGYEAGGINEAAYQGAKGTSHTLISAEILSPGSTLAQIGRLKELPAAVRTIIPNLKNGATALKEAATLTNVVNGAKTAKDVLTLANATTLVNGGANFAGRMALANAAVTELSDVADYAIGRKELNTDNWASTALDTTMNLDPLRAISFGKLNVSQGVDKVLGTFGLTEGKGEDILAVKNETMGIYAQQAQRFQPGMIDPSLRKVDTNDPDRPLMSGYTKLTAIRHQLRNYTDKDSSGKPTGKIGGYDIGSEFDKIDFTDSKNYLAYKTAMNRMMLEQQKIMAKNDKGFRQITSSWLPFSRGHEQAQKYDAAESNVALLTAAESEFGMFEQRMLAYKRGQKERTAHDQAEHERQRNHSSPHPVTGGQPGAMSAPVTNGICLDPATGLTH